MRVVWLLKVSAKPTDVREHNLRRCENIYARIRLPIPVRRDVHCEIGHIRTHCVSVLVSKTQGIAGGLDSSVFDICLRMFRRINGLFQSANVSVLWGWERKA